LIPLQDGLVNATVVAEFCCRLCGSRDLVLHYTQGNDDRYRYYKCRHCELVNLDLSAGLDQTQYTEDLEDPEDEQGRFNRQMGQSFDFLLRHVAGAESFCDIGCGNGRMLLLAKRRGWRVLGIELSEDAARQAAAKLDVEVIAGNFLAVEPAPCHHRAFEIVCLRHVLEHLPDSRLAMQRIRALLKPKGHLLLEMPNIEALGKRLKRAIVNLGLHERRFRDDFVAGHCNEFCKGSLEFLLAQTGFRLVHWETYSEKPLRNWIYNRFPIGNKARALAQVLD
jgi:2-polyprenyl-3-methyl-5-hydroxy-6-metoxy-1,4-benzoquinol methylase